MDNMQKKILIVEDDQVLMRMLVNMLHGRGFDVLEARNGIEGIEQTNETKPDLILLDIDMPKMNGIAMLRSLKDGGKRIPAILLTNLNDPNLIADAAALGASEYLIKSEWDINEIGDKIEGKMKHLLSHE